MVLFVTSSPYVNDADRAILSNDNEFIDRIRSGVVKLDISQITYVEIMNHSLLYHTVRDVYECKGSLTETAAKLEKEHFFRISNCYLVNLEYVESVCASDTTVNGEVLSVSHFPFNAKSRHVIKKLGFACEGLLRCAQGLPDGTAYDLMCYSLLKSEYEARKLDK